MRKNLLLSAFVFFLVACAKKDEPTPVVKKPTAEITAIIAATRLPEPADYAARAIANFPVASNSSASGSNYSCSKTRFKVAKRFNPIYNTFQIGDPSISELYVGNIIDLKELASQNYLKSISGLARDVINISSSLPNSGVRKITSPSKSAVNSAIDDMVSKFSGTLPNSGINYEAKEAYSKEQGLLSFGVNGGYGIVKGSAALTLGSDVEERYIYIMFRQEYHTVSVNNPPDGAAGFFAASVTPANIQSVNSATPMGYISQVTYGRVLLAKMTYKTKEYEQAISLAVQINAKLASGGVSFSSSDRQKFSNSDVQVDILGGDPASATQITQLGGKGIEAIEKINNFIQQGANNPKLGVPISYVVRYLDNTLFSTGSEVEYDVSDCLLNPRMVVIKSVLFTELPQTTTIGSAWDSGFNLGTDRNPDVYYQIIENGITVRSNRTGYISNITANDLAQNKVFFSNVNYEITNLNSNIIIRAIDNDDAGSDELMGYIGMLFSDSFYRTNKYPRYLLYDQSNPVPTTGTTRVTVKARLELEWR